MITVLDMKFELRIDPNDATKDEELLRYIERAENFIRGYTNNSDLDFSELPQLDECVLYLSLMYANPEMKGRQGVSSISSGVNVNFLNDLPKEIKTVLNKYKRVKFT